MKLKFDIDEDEVPGQSAKVGAWIGGGFAVFGAIVCFVQGEVSGILSGIAYLILGTPLCALGGALAGWIIGWIIKLVIILVINIKNREEERAKKRAKRKHINQIKEKYPTDDEDDTEYYDILERKARREVGLMATLKEEGKFATEKWICTKILNEIGIEPYLLDSEYDAFKKICSAQTDSCKNWIIMRMVLERFITYQIENLANHPVEWYGKICAEMYMDYVPEEKQNVEIRAHATRLILLYTKSRNESKPKIDTNIWSRDNTDPYSFKNTWANETAHKVFLDE